MVSAVRDALARAADPLFEDESMTLKTGHSVLAIGFEEADIADWTEHEPLRVHSIACGTLADAVVAGSTVDALLLDCLGHTVVPDSVRRLRSAAPSVGIVMIVDHGMEEAALREGAHEVLSALHAAGDLDLAIRRATARAQAGLRSSPMTMDSVFGRVPAPMYRTLLSGEIIQANAPMAALLGYERADDLIGRDAIEFYADPRVRSRYVERLRTSGEVERIEFLLRRRDGSAVWAAVMSYIVEDGFGRPLYIEGLILDVTELMQERRRSTTAEQVHEWMFAHSPVPLWEMDYSKVAAAIEDLGGRDGLEARLSADPLAVHGLLHGIELRYVNQAALAFLGVDEETELQDLGFAPFAVAEGDDLALTQLRAIADGADQFVLPIEGHNAAGDVVHARVVWLAGSFDHLQPYSRVAVAVMDDTAVHEQQRALERLIESKDAFISSVAHHLRTPLTAILGFAAEMHEDGDRFSPDETMGMLGELVAAAKAATNIVEDMAVAARTEIDTLQYHIRPLALDDLVGQMAEEMAPEAALAIDPVMAMADGARTRQVVRAVVSNALRHGGPTVTITTHASEGFGWVEVADDGNGVSDECALRIFEPYFSGDGSPTSPSPIGLGLHVARRLARDMGGDLEYHRQLGTTVFRLRLPLAV